MLKPGATLGDALHLVCPHCDTVNRIAATRLEDGPKCGQCHQRLFAAHPVELTAVTLQKHLQRSELPLLVEFWAPWCGPCKLMAPQLVEAAALLEPRVRLAKVNTEQEPALSTQFMIRAIPTLLLLRGGRELARHSGAMGSAEIVQWTRARI